MPKKPLRKNRSTRVTRKTKPWHIVHYRWIVVVSLVLVFGGGFVFALNRTLETQVMGAKTLLAEGGNSGSGSLHSGQGSSGGDTNQPHRSEGVRSGENGGSIQPEVSGEDLRKKHKNMQEVLLREGRGGKHDGSAEAEVEHNGLPEVEHNGQPEVEMHGGNDDVNVASNGAQGFMLRQRKTGATVKFPVSIDPATNTLQVDTPSGKQHVVVLPEDAVKNALAANAISSVSADAAENSLKLESQDGKLVYHMHGNSRQKLLGLFSVDIGKDVRVSAQTGSVDTQNESFGASVLDFFSF